MASTVLGIDLSKRKFDVALLQESQWHSATFSNDLAGFKKLQQWLKQRRVKELWACMEATGRYGEELALWLHARGYRVSVVNPMQLKKYAESQLQRNKTDRLDARILADYCLCQEPALWTPPAVEKRQLQAMVRRLDVLIEDRTRELNRFKSGQHPEIVADSIKAHLAFIDGQVAQLEEQIHDHIDRHPGLKEDRALLTSIPGIGKRTAARLLGELPDLDAFDNANQLVAYAGLSPRQHHSGASVHRATRLTYIGKRALRRTLYLPALVAQRHNPIIQAQRQRLLAKGKKKMVTVGAAMRKLLRLVYGVLKSRIPFDPYYAVNVQSPA